MSQKPGVELSAEQEALAQRVYQRLRAKVDEELLAMVRMMAGKANHELFGPGEFALRDMLHQVGRTVVEESVNERKKGVPGS
jgi:hypothetical protein